MRQFAFCECDKEASERGDPFCGFCGRRAGSPAFQDGTVALPLNLPLRVPVKPAAGKPFLTLEVKTRAAGRGFIASSRVLDAQGKLLLKRIDLECLNRRYEELEFTVNGAAFSFSLPREFDGGGLPCTALLRCQFELRNPALCQPFVHTLVLQPAGLFKLESDDSRFEDRADAAAAAFDPYSIWLFEDVTEPITLVLSAEARPDYDALPPFTAAWACTRDGARVQRAGTIVASPGKPAHIQLDPAALRQLLAPAKEGSLFIRADRPDGEEAAIFDIQALARRTPRLWLDSPVVYNIQFKRNNRGWLTKGCENFNLVRNFDDEVKLWQPQFKVCLVPDDALNQAAVFTAQIEDSYLKINARLKPDWLRSNTQPQMDGEAKLLLRNTNNSRHTRAFTPPETFAPLTSQVKIVIGRERRDPVPVLAIDFGTTNTCAAVISSNADPTSRVIEVNGDLYVPSLLFYLFNSDANGKDGARPVKIGKNAKSQGRYAQSACFVKAIKTELLRPDQRKIIVGNLSLTAQQITADFLTQFFQSAMLNPDIDGRPINQLVFTFPVAASPRYVELLSAAIAKAVDDLKLPIAKESIVRSCDEASAGGIWWFCQKQNELKSHEKVSVLVFDYGGGTTDLSVLEFTRKADRKWQVTIKGISGISPCGGEDLTWRMAREFIVCANKESQREESAHGAAAQPPLLAIRPDTTLGKKLAEVAEFEGRDDWQKPYTRSLLEMIEERKMAAVGGEQREMLPKPVLLDLLENSESAFVPSAIEFRGDHSPLEDSCAPGSGNLAICGFSQFKQDPRNEFEAATGDGMLPGHVWLFKVQNRLLEEPVSAVQVAGNLIEHLYGNGKVDHLLLIGQASKTYAVRALIESQLKDKFGEISEEGIQNPKSCVALGACDFELQRIRWDFRRSLLKRVIYRDCETIKQLLRSDDELNTVTTLADPELLLAPDRRLCVMVDWIYAPTGLGLRENGQGLREEMDLLGAGFETRKPEEKVNVVVAAPSEKETYKTLDAGIRAIVDELDRGNTANRWYFLAWVGDDLSHAWKFAYHV